MAWSRTTLTTGPLSENRYMYNITGLTPNTIYRYRSFFIIDDVEYRGNNIYTGLTQQIDYQEPTVLTGGVENIEDMSIEITGNSITNSGNFEPFKVFEYGIIYTQNPIYGNENSLIYTTNNKYVKILKENTIINSIPFNFNSDINELSPNTNTYYRAYAKNPFGIGYGQINISKTTNNMNVVLINPMEISKYESMVQLKGVGRFDVFTSIVIEFEYHLEVYCENTQIPGNIFDNETKVKIIDYNNQNVEIFMDLIHIGIRETQWNGMAETTPNPKFGSVDVKRLDEIYIIFNYNFDNIKINEEIISIRNTNGYIKITSVKGFIDNEEYTIKIIGDNKFSIVATLSGDSGTATF